MVLRLKSELHSQDASALADFSELQLRMLCSLVLVSDPYVVSEPNLQHFRVWQVATANKGMKYTALGDCSSTDVLSITSSKHKLAP